MKFYSGQKTRNTDKQSIIQFPVVERNKVHLLKDCT